MPRSVPNDDKLLTLPQIHRLYGIGLKSLRRAAARGAFPVYSADTSWPRVKRSDFEQWLESTRINPSNGDNRALM